MCYIVQHLLLASQSRSDEFIALRRKYYLVRKR